MLHSTPRGFRDVLPPEALARERIQDLARAVFSAHGYLPVETPLLEATEVLARAGHVKGTPFQLIDSDDRLLMLRPDLTLPIARLVASRMGGEELPLRLRYQAPVVREQDSLKGVARQFTQMGVELVGAPDVEAEAEVLALLGDALTAMGIGHWSIVCGSVRPLQALVALPCVPPELGERVLGYVHRSDLVGLDQAVASACLPAPVAEALHGLPRLCGGPEVLARLAELLSGAGVDPASAGLPELTALCERSQEFLPAGALAFDFSILGSFDYYTGLVFKAYAPGVAWSVASGGRYDAVLQNLDAEAVGACGFSLSLERVQEALEAPQPGAGGEGSASARPRLRIAVPKGGLFKPAVALLEQAGLPVASLRDLGRKLIVAEGDYEYLIVRAQDAPAFVASGGAQCGICGTDSLFEAGVNLIQLQDLGFGACHFVVAEPASAAGRAEQTLARTGAVRVATKYPRITQAYYDRIGCAVDILALHGNIELGPIVGIADRIVDITATGTTLRENDLVVVDDDVMDCSARFFSAPAAYRTDPRVRALSQALAAAVAQNDRA